MSLISDYTGFFYPKKDGKIQPLFPDISGVGMSASGEGESFLSKLKLPSIGTTAKVAGTGAILYTGYEAAQAGGRLFETGSFTKKEITTNPTTPGSGGAGFDNYPQGEGLLGNIGAGIGQGAMEFGKGAGTGIEMALPIIAIGSLAFLIMRGRK